MSDAIAELQRSIARLEDPTAVHYTSEASKAEMLTTMRAALAKLEAAPVVTPIEQPELTREYLIDLCERSIVSVGSWADRDTPGTQEKVGMAWALLKAGCVFRIPTDPGATKTTIWITLHYPSFNSFEYDRTDPQYLNELLVYLPTEERLHRRAAKGQDWY